MRHLLTRAGAIAVATGLCLLSGVPTIGHVGAPGPASASTPATCSGGDFVGGWVGKNGATGTSIFVVAFVNEGRTTCRLAGYPTIQGYRDGRRYPLHAQHITSQPFGLSPTVVGPQMSGELVLTTSGLCNALNSGGRAKINSEIADNTYAVSVEFPHSNDPIYIYGLNLDVACGLDVTGLGWR